MRHSSKPFLSALLPTSSLNVLPWLRRNSDSGNTGSFTMILLLSLQSDEPHKFRLPLVPCLFCFPVCATFFKRALHPVKHKEFSPLPTAVSSKWKRWLSERTNIHHWKQPSTEGCILPHCVCVAPVKVLSNAFIN